MKHALLSVLTALLLCAGLLAITIMNVASTESLMLRLMERYAPPEDTRLPASEYESVVKMITSYIGGDLDTFQHIFTVDGAEYAAFNQKEQQHMADVQMLFRLCNEQFWILGFVAALALIVEFHLAYDERTLRIFRRTLLAILAAVTAIIILAAIDFNSLFILFHKVAFTNDLWLLDPRTDLLIRLMPIEFFISYAAIIGGIWLLGMLAMLVFATVRINKMQTNEGE